MSFAAHLDPAVALRYLERTGHAFCKVGKVWKGLCCFHGDSDPSLTLHRDGKFYCHACGWSGSIADYIIELNQGNRDDRHAFHRALVTLGLSEDRPDAAYKVAPLPAAFAAPPPPEPPPPARPADAAHRWYDRATGALAMLRRRWYLTADERPRYGGRGKVIRPYLPDGRMGEPKEADLAIYGGPALPPPDPARPVFVSESESDADAVTAAGGLCVATGGARRWRDVWGPDLAGRWLVLLPHNDPAGQEWAARVQAATQAHAARLTVLALPGLAAHGDVRDYLAGGRTLDALEAVADYAGALAAAPPTTPAPDVQALRDELAHLRAWKKGVEAILDNKDLEPTDRVGLLALQRLHDAGQVPRGEPGEISQQDWAKARGVSPSTMSRWLDRWDKMDLIRHTAGPDPQHPVLDRNGNPRYTRRGEPMYEKRTHLACNVAPFEAIATITLASPIMSTQGLRHGGKRQRGRICPNPACDGLADDQTDFQGRQCKSCGTVYDPDDPETAYQARDVGQWRESYFHDESTPAAGAAPPAIYLQTENGAKPTSCTVQVDAPPDTRATAAQIRATATDNPRAAAALHQVRRRLHRADQDAAVNEHIHYLQLESREPPAPPPDEWCRVCGEYVCTCWQQEMERALTSARSGP